MSFPSTIDSPRIVIPIVAGIGNALLAVPLVRQIKRKLPNSRITILARVDAMGEVFRRLDEVDEVRITGKAARGLARQILWSRREKPDVYLVPFPSNRWQYSLLAFVSGAKMRVLHSYPVGYFRALHFLPSRRIPALRGIHDVLQNLNLLRAMGIEPDPPAAPVFGVNDADRARAAEMLGDLSPIVVHAGSAQTILAQAKRWPADSYAKLIAELRREFGDRVIILEGPDEIGVADEIGSDVKVIRLNGALGVAAAILERAELYVGSDSGLAHLAAAVGTPTVTIFAPADPDRVCPFGQRAGVVQALTQCAPCFQYPWKTPYPKLLCREPYCVATVTVESVLSTVRKQLATRPQEAAS